MERWRRSWRSWKERFSQDFEYESIVELSGDPKRVVLQLKQAPSGSCALKQKKENTNKRSEDHSKRSTSKVPGLARRAELSLCHPDDDTLEGAPAKRKNVVDDVSQEESDATLPDKAVTGGTVWDASLVLAKWLERNPGLVRGKRCIELGAGIGLVSSVACCLGAELVVASDRDEFVCLLDMNLKRTIRQVDAVRPELETGFALSSRLVAEKYHWESPADFERLRSMYGSFDVVLCADVIYEELASQALFQTLMRLTEESIRTGVEPVIYLAQDEHLPQVFDGFLTRMKKVFRLERVNNTELDPIYSSDLIKVYVFHARHAVFTEKSKPD